MDNIGNSLNLTRSTKPNSKAGNRPRKALDTSFLSASFAFNNTLSPSLCRSTTPHKKKTEPGHKNLFFPPKLTQYFQGDKISPRIKSPPIGDRFIPSRRGTDVEARELLMSEGFQNYENLSPKSQEAYKAKTEAFYGPEIMNKRVITYQNKAPQPTEEYDQKLKVLYAPIHSSSKKKKKRVIPSCPDRILDAPDILNDYYINVIDWGPTNQIAVCLSSQLYIWDAVSSKITQLSSLEEGDHYSSVAWAGHGRHLAVGTSEGAVEIWDVGKGRRLRSMPCTGGRVGALAWNSHLVSAGQTNGGLAHHDVRVANHVVSSQPTAHTATICGLHWSLDGRNLASGGNDNAVQVWSLSSPTTPLHRFTDHQAAVKAVRWCPWQNDILATGGGTGDRCIRLWNINRGYCFKTIDTGSQVSSVLWNKEYKELVSGHGFSKHELNIWKYPDLTKVAELQGHEGRILNLASSPDGAYVMSAGADETLRIWNCFVVDPEKKKKEAQDKERSLSKLTMGSLVIR